MIRITVGSNVLLCDVKTLDLEGNDLTLQLKISPNLLKTIEVTFPDFPKEIKDIIRGVGVDKFKNSELDLNKGTIEFLS